MTLVRIIMENIGPIKKVDNDLVWLVVIAGVNDKGKSTMGKMLYSIIRAFSKYQAKFVENQSVYLARKACNLYALLRGQINVIHKEDDHNRVRNDVLEALRDFDWNSPTNDFEMKLNVCKSIIQDSGIDEDIRKRVYETISDIE